MSFLPDKYDPKQYKERGTAEAFKEDSYTIGQLVYPSDIHSNKNEYGTNFVVFYINVLEASRMVPMDKSNFVDEKLVPARLRGDTVNIKNPVAGATLAGVGGAAGALASGTAAVSGFLDKGLLGALKNLAIPAALAGANAIGAEVISGMSEGKMKRETKRLKQVISLHVPTELNVTYGMSYDQDVETSSEQLAMAGASPEILNAAGSGAAVLALNKGSAKNVLSGASGMSANPKKENLFKSVEFRGFQFSYQFFPRNADESQKIKEIIRMFKFHMHPEYKDSNGFLFLYPSEFDISYYVNGKENLNLHRHTSCVLTAMNVYYTPNQNFNTFPDGTPTQINMSLTFKELAILTKSEINDGF